MLRVENLTKRYGALEALKGVTFSVSSGEILGYLGPNGAGKSTTVRILAGIIQKTSGKIDIMDLDPDKDPVGVKKKIGYVPESGAIYECLTGYEYLIFVGRLYELEDKVIKYRIDKYLELFGMRIDAFDTISSLSKGMRQKILLTASLIHDPDVLLLDEPLQGLDANSAFIVKDLLKHLAKDGKIIIFCSHVLEVVERLCTRIIIIDEGNIISECTPETLKIQDASLEETFRRLTANKLTGVTEEFLQALKKGP